jgi:hypothetical protein
VEVRWQTAGEWNHLGFHVYRTSEPGAWADVSETAERVTVDLVRGSVDGRGQTYSIADPGAGTEQTRYYWLADVDTDHRATIHGPAVVAAAGSVPDGAVATFAVAANSIAAGRIVAIGYDDLAAAGLPVSVMDASEYRAWVGTNEVALYVSASRGLLSEDDYLLFYCGPAAADAIQVSLGAGPNAKRMGYAYAEPLGGDVFTDALGEDQMLVFSVGDAYNTCLLTGLTDDEAWVLDVTDPLDPVLLFGYVILQLDDEAGVYLSHFPDGEARCIVLGSSAILELRGVLATPAGRPGGK